MGLENGATLTTDARTTLVKLSTYPWRMARFSAPLAI